MRPSTRFLLDNLFILAAAYVVIAAMTWRTGVTAGWIAFGISTGIAVLAGTSAVLARTVTRKAGHGLVALAALWSLIASLVFAGTALHWLVLANTILVGAFALTDLAVHEVTTEKVVHQLAVPTTANGRAPAEERIAAQRRRLPALNREGDEPSGPVPFSRLRAKPAAFAVRPKRRLVIRAGTMQRSLPSSRCSASLSGVAQQDGGFGTGFRGVKDRPPGTPQPPKSVVTTED